MEGDRLVTETFAESRFLEKIEKEKNDDNDDEDDDNDKLER